MMTANKCNPVLPQIIIRTDHLYGRGERFTVAAIEA